MTISDFARERNVEPQAVARYISRHPEIQKHTRKEGKAVELLPEAEKLLDEKYPLPKPVQIIQGVSHEEYETLLKKSIQQQDVIIQLQQRLEEQARQIAKAESMQILLEDKERQLAEAKEQSRVQIEEERDRTRAADEELERLKKRNLLERIFNK